MNAKPIKREFLGTFDPMFEYRGFTIYKGRTPIWNKDCNYIDKNGNPANDKKPLYHSMVIKNKSSNYYNQIYASMFGGNDGLENDYTSENWEYTKKQIDSHIENQREYKRKRIQIFKNSRFAVYECNNVTIRVLIEQSPYNKYENRATIYVNERALRDVYLSPDFVFTDVLKQVYYNTISKYNIPNFSDKDIKTNYIRNKSHKKIDISILPVYELLGFVCRFEGVEFIPIDVRKTNEGFSFDCGKSGQIEITTGSIKNIEIIGEVNDTLINFVALKNKIKFYE